MTNPNPSPECICGKRFTMCEDGHAIDCPASNQFAKWQEMATPAALSQTLPAPSVELIARLRKLANTSRGEAFAPGMRHVADEAADVIAGQALPAPSEMPTIWEDPAGKGYPCFERPMTPAEARETIDRLSARIIELEPTLPAPGEVEARMLYEVWRMASRGAENVAHELDRDPKWQPTRTDFGSLGTLLLNIAATTRAQASLATVAAANDEGVAVERYRHVKRGTVYEIVGRAQLQIATGDVCEGSELVIYRGDDGKLWARESGEFNDGRFEPLATSRSQHEGAPS